MIYLLKLTTSSYFYFQYHPCGADYMYDPLNDVDIIAPGHGAVLYDWLFMIAFGSHTIHLMMRMRRPFRYILYSYVVFNERCIDMGSRCWR